MDGKNSKKKYQPPMIIELGQVPVAEGQGNNCNQGSAASGNCITGGTAGGNCNTGGNTEGASPFLPEPQDNTFAKNGLSR